MEVYLGLFPPHMPTFKDANVWFEGWPTPSHLNTQVCGKFRPCLQFSCNCHGPPPLTCCSLKPRGGGPCGLNSLPKDDQHLTNGKDTQRPG